MLWAASDLSVFYFFLPNLFLSFNKKESWYWNLISDSEITLPFTQANQERNLPITSEVKITCFSISQKLKLYHFLILQLLLVCLKNQKEKKAYKEDSIKEEIEVCAITKCSNIFTVYNIKLPHNMTDEEDASTVLTLKVQNWIWQKFWKYTQVFPRGFFFFNWV